MSDEALDAVRVTAQRVERFASDVEHDDSHETRLRWRASLEDLRDMIRRARARGHEIDAIQEAAGDQPTGHFVREPAAGQAQAPQPDRV